jgi:superoxide dismutase, Fe-Mn family
MAPLTSRRDFLWNTGKVGIGITLGASFLSSCKGTKLSQTGSHQFKFTTGLRQEPLPYSYSALNEAIDAQTMEIHYSKHAASYATNLNDAVNTEIGANSRTTVEELLLNISKYSAKMRNNAGGHYNHELFWKCMSPNSAGKPAGSLDAAITSSFGSFDAFKTAFTDAGKNRFGSGWAWLIIDNDKKLHITSTPNQDNPIMNIAEQKGFPLLGLDVWEHAYYLRYQNKRPDYIANWWKVVNWNFVQDRYQSMI